MTRRDLGAPCEVRPPSGVCVILSSAVKRLGLFRPGDSRQVSAPVPIQFKGGTDAPLLHSAPSFRWPTMPAVAITPDMLVSHAAAVIHEHASSRDRGLLLALLTYAPTEKGRVGVANKIIHGENMHSEDPTTDWGHLQQTADFYWRNIIIPGATRTTPCVGV